MKMIVEKRQKFCHRRTSPSTNLSQYQFVNHSFIILNVLIDLDPVYGETFYGKCDEIPE